MKELVWNVSVTMNTPTEIINDILSTLHSEHSEQIAIACANPHSQVVASLDHEFLQALNRFEIVLPDGMGTVLASKVLNGKICGRFTGPDFFRSVSSSLNTVGNPYSYFLLGSTRDVLDGMEKNMRAIYPHIPIAGSITPPFGSISEEETQKIITIINEVKPTFLWVGMTAPKQEKWIAKYRDRINCRVLAGIGAEFDYFSGNKKRPPVILARLGLQWLHRFVLEPKRTWRRHIISMPIFLMNIITLILRQGWSQLKQHT